MGQLIRTYPQLRGQVKRTLLEGQAKIEALKLEVYWKTGRLIARYLETLAPGPRNATDLLDRLASDLQMERSMFFRVLQFAETYPQGVAPGRLSWTHYRSLISVEGKERRRRLERRAVREAWPARRLRHEIDKTKDAREKKTSGVGSNTLEEPVRHPARVRKVKRTKEIGVRAKLRVDLGFEVHREMTPKSTRLKEGDWVQWNGKARKWERKGKAEALYYYEAQVIRVVDGDTLLVNIDLGFKMHRRQYLRLRGINAEEKDSKKGKRATAFLNRIIRKSPRILLRTHLTDRYDRFLADVWAGKAYVNNALLEKNLAVKV